METVLAGTGACSAYDVVLILKRGRHDVRGCQVRVTSERAERDPKVFTAIHLHFVVTGVGLAPILFRYEVQALADAAGGVVRRDGER
jgi:putative redox protein